MADRIQVRRDTAANWTSANPTLAQGEIGYETDTDKVKIGDGTTAWTSLGYVIDTGGYLVSSDIGSTVQAYSSVLQNTTASFTTADETKLDAIDQGVATTDSPTFAGLTVDTNTLYVDSANDRVGVGTSSPSEKLSVIGNTSLGGDLSFFGNLRGIGQSSSTSLGVSITGGTSNTDGASITIYGKDHATNAGNMYITAGGATGTGETVFRRRLDAAFAESMRIDTSGNVGIGTSSPSTLLHVNGDTTLGGGVTETVYALSGTTPALDPSNGTVQTWTLSGNSTPTDSLSAGEAITLMIDDGTAYTINWATSMSVTWVNNGGSAPTLATTGYTVIALWKVSTTLYGALVGDGS
jgi:hypothetical protein